jgi:hypothetical protein
MKLSEKNVTKVRTVLFKVDKLCPQYKAPEPKPGLLPFTIEVFRSSIINRSYPCNCERLHRLTPDGMATLRRLGIRKGKYRPGAIICVCEHMGHVVKGSQRYIK